MMGMPSVLERIVAEKRNEIATLKSDAPADVLAHRISDAPSPKDFAAALKRGQDDGIHLIAEFKRASPSKGMIRIDLDPAQVAQMYASSGASAMSVLTDGPFFSGSMDDLRAVRRTVDLPLLRKDFILDPYQIMEARVAGADALLLIVAALDDTDLTTLHAEADRLGMATLVEVHNETELDRALAIGPRIIGINNRNLHTFEVDLGTTLTLRSRIPGDIIVVGESGIHSRADAVRLEQAGVDAMLVGEALMREPDPADAARALLG